MRAEIVYTPKNDFREGKSDLEERIKELKLSGFDPNFMLMFLTAGTFKDWKRYNELFQKHFPDVEMLGCVIEGYAAGDEIWTRGIVALLGEFDGEVKVYFERGNKVEEVCSRLGARIGEKYDSILAMFPAFYFPSRLEFARLFINDRLYYRRYRGKETVEEKKEVLKEYSRYLEDHFIFPIDKVLRYLSESTGKGTPIIGMNLMPMEAKVGTPVILADYKEVGRGVAAMCLKGKVNTVYHDIYPERGNSFEETVEIINSYFSNAEEVGVIKAGIAVGEINGMPPVEFLRVKRAAYEKVDEERFLDSVERGKLQTVTPYGLAFISKKYYSVVLLGIINSPVNLYPSLISTDDFYDRCMFVGETFRGGPQNFALISKKKELSGFDLYILDADVIPAFGKGVYKIIESLEGESKRKLCVFTMAPSVYHPKLDKKIFSMLFENSFFSSAGTNALLEFGNSEIKK
ncbi:MAG: hypothetical protein H0Z28_13590 [Archaeoglobus sp.]|nr:hypothetical protein [Archaeoglobus sp.]